MSLMSLSSDGRPARALVEFCLQDLWICCNDGESKQVPDSQLCSTNLVASRSTMSASEAELKVSATFP